MTDEPINPLKEEIEAIGRIAMSRDGRTLHRYLRRMVESICTSDQSRALPRHEGGRMFAARLMAHMAQGIESSGGRDPNEPTKRGDEPILNRAGGPVHVSKPRDTRRVQLEPGDGWDPGDTGKD